jgi:hypothetical protein
MLDVDDDICEDAAAWDDELDVLDEVDDKICGAVAWDDELEVLDEVDDKNSGAAPGEDELDQVDEEDDRLREAWLGWPEDLDELEVELELRTFDKLDEVVLDAWEDGMGLVKVLDVEDELG